MRSLHFLFFPVLLLLSACSHQQETPVAASSPPAAPPPATSASADDTVVIPPGSPKLKEVHVEAVTTAEVPFEEVVSPGKIETNPNLVSRVLLPLAGRVSAVLVHLGDSVRQGDPVLTLESPDAEAAQSAYLQAQEVRNTMEYSYRRGEASLVEFLDAQRAFNDARQSYNDARADYARSLYLMDSISGKAVNP